MNKEQAIILGGLAGLFLAIWILTHPTGVYVIADTDCVSKNINNESVVVCNVNISSDTSIDIAHDVEALRVNTQTITQSYPPGTTCGIDVRCWW